MRATIALWIALCFTILVGTGPALAGDSAPVDAGLAVSIVGEVTVDGCGGGAAQSATPFMKIRVGDVLQLAEGATVALVFFESGIRESWSGPDTLAIGTMESSYDWTVPEIEETTCRIKVIVRDGAGLQAIDTSDADFEIRSGTAVYDNISDKPFEVVLEQNRPNPFNPTTEILFGLPKAMDVRIRIYNVEGRLVNTLVEDNFPAGYHHVAWLGKDDNGIEVATGIYFYRMETSDKVITRKMLMLK